MSHILIADDDATLAALLEARLREEGFDVVRSADGPAALQSLRARPPLLVVVDVSAPARDGWGICRLIRRESDVPIIIVSTRCGETDRIAGFRLGADDYVEKPYSPVELVERIKAILRRASLAQTANAGAVLAHHGLALAPDAFTVTTGGKQIALTLSEFRILETLMRAPGRVFSREQLLDVLGRDNRDVFDRAVDVHVVNLRRKLKEGCDKRDFVETVRGVGYRLSL